ncbi:MAG: hypothetical protein HC844_00900 [Tabrizicola sp.]|nr:hypothetical protein [Tabrizicola sp.]
MSWPVVALGEVAEIEREGIAADLIPNGTDYLGLEHIESGGIILGKETVANGDLASTKFTFTSDHLLYGKLRPYLAKIALPEFDGVCSTDILPIRPGPRLDKRFLAFYLRQSSMVDYAASRATGANLPRLSPTALSGFPVPLPPLVEQRRIAGILDQADALRRLRTRALDRLTTLGQAIFHEMFGDPKTEPDRWQAIGFDEACRDETAKSPKVQKTEYQIAGKIPVIDQGQKEVAGYTESENVCKSQGPVIVFGDHTKAVKYIDFPFAIGADGAKVLKPSKLYEPIFFAALLRNLPIPDLGYSRHMREVKKMRFPAPPVVL